MPVPHPDSHRPAFCHPERNWEGKAKIIAFYPTAKLKEYKWKTRHYDKHRNNELESHGWSVLRFTQERIERDTGKGGVPALRDHQPKQRLPSPQRAGRV